mgnify:CR=1 FL=1
MSNLERLPVRKVAQVLKSKGHQHKIIELSNTARSADDAAKSLGVAVGAIVKTLLFIVVVDEKKIPVVALVSGNGMCDTGFLSSIIGLKGKVTSPNADDVKLLTGFSIGGVSPLGLPSNFLIFMDTSLGNYEEIWSAAGHPHCVFKSTYAQLLEYTGATPSSKLLK